MVEVLVIGLDGASWDLVRRWTASGDLPALASLRERGVMGQLESVFPPVTVPAWYAYATGMNPGRFGVFDRSMIEGTDTKGSRFGNFEERLADATSVDAPFVWNWLADHDRDAAALGVPSMYPAYGVPGAEVVSGPAIGGSQWAYPQSIKDRVEEVAEGYATKGTPNLTDDPVDEIEDAIKSHSERIHSVTLDWLESGDPPDFLQTVYFSTDMAGHVFWPEHEAKGTRDRLKEHYQWIDEKVGQLLERIDDETDVIIISDHGMGPIYDRFRLNDWLVQEDYLRLASEHKPLLSRLGLTRERAAHLLSALPGGELLRQRVPRMMKKQVSHSNPRIDKLDVDWEVTDAFGLGEVGQIYVDTKEGYDRVRENLIDDLELFVDREGIDATINPKEEVYRGDDATLATAPDVLFTLQSFEFGVTHGYSGNGLWQHGGNRDSPVGGAHRQQGVFMAAGPSFDSGREDARLVDVVPTILHAMGEPIPEEADGEVLADALTTDSEPEYEDHTDRSWTNLNHDTDQNDRRNQLEALGYLE